MIIAQHANTDPDTEFNEWLYRNTAGRLIYHRQNHGAARRAKGTRAVKEALPNTEVGIRRAIALFPEAAPRILAASRADKVAATRVSAS